MIALTRAGVGLALLCLAGCGTTPVYNVVYDETYHAGETKTSSLDMPVVVRGNPFGVPQPELDSAVVDAMQGWSAWQDHFIVATNPNTPYRVVVIFNPTRSVGYGAYCERPLTVDGASATAPAPRALMAATLCRGGTYLASLYGSVDLEGGPQGAAFREAIRQATILLFPVQNPLQAPCASC
jgi:hypothetical protein